MAKDKEKSGKGFAISLVVFGSVLSAVLPYYMPVPESAKLQPINQTASHFFSISSNLLTPFFALVAILAALSFITVILKVLDILDFDDFWDLFN